MTEETSRGKAYCCSGCQRGVLGRRAATDPAHDVLDDDDAVVDQEAKRNDDCGDRYLLDRDAEHAHADDGKHDGKWNDHRRDQAGAQPEEDDDQAADDDEGLRDVRKRGVDGGAHLFRLIRREVDRVADRQACLVIARRRAKPSAELRDVLVGLHDDAQHDSRPPIEIDRLDLGRDIAASNGHEVGKPNQAVGRSDPRQHRLDGAHIREIAGCFQQYARAVRIDVAGRQDDVLRLKILDQRVELNADRGKLPGIDFQPYALVLDAKKFDLGDARQLVKLFAEVFRHVFHFAIRKSLACYRNGRNRDVAEVAVDEWTEGTLGQIGFDVVHLVAQPLPRRVDIADLVLQVDVDNERSFGGQACECP